MDSQRWNKLRDVFITLAELPAADQEQALRDLYSSDPIIAREVQELMEEDASSQNLPELNLDHLLAEALQNEKLDSSLQVQIGPYRIIRMLGEGGMGVVYLAERTDFPGSVAIKLLRDSWISPLRRQRFAFEQQTLGLLNHSSIARIYDAGTTSDGTPWFVMEFVDGLNITEYLHREAKSGREILKLFRQICEAVRFAHSHAVIHRDLKPSNILVTEAGRIKLLDFGIAKQMDLASRGGSATAAGLGLFTPAYAAPELLSRNDVGVFTDIYSLGVILYELLTGRLPYPGGRSADRNPEAPSALGLKSGSTVNHGLSKSEWGDIDAICMKALDREAKLRYGTVDALISDVEAFLGDRPLDARKNTFFYGARKFAWRHRVPLVSVAIGILVVITAIVFFTVRLARARDAALTAAAHSERVQRFTESLFTGGVAGYGVPPPAIKVTAMLDRGRSQTLNLTGDSQLQNDMLRILGIAYLNLRHYADAETLLRRAQQGSCGPSPSLDCAQVEAALANLDDRQDSSRHDAESLLRDALQTRQKLLPPNDPAIAKTLLDLGEQRIRLSDYVGAKELIAKALAIASMDGRPTPLLADAMDDYGEFAYKYNDPQALSYAERTAQIFVQVYGSQSYEYGVHENTLATISMNLGRYHQAETYDRQALAAIQAWSGPDEMVTVRYRERLAFILSLQGKFKEAKPLLEQALSILARSGNPPDADTGIANFNLGFIALQQGKFNAAEPFFDKVLALAPNRIATTDPNLQTSELGLAEIYAKRGEFKRSEAMCRSALRSGRLEGDYGATAGHALLGHALLKERRPREAEGELQKAYTWFSHDPKIRPQTIETYKDLAQTESLLGRNEEAARIRAELRAHPD